MTNDKYRLMFWGPGHIGGATLRAALERPEFEVVGARVYNPAKVGVDIGELVGVDAIGVLATDNIDDLLGLEADCVIFTPLPMDFEALDSEVTQLLKAGHNVVTTTTYHYPARRGADVLAKLEAACAEGGSTLYGTGIHPDFITERLVMTLTGLMTQIDHIRIVESIDCTQMISGMGNEFVAAIGWGLDPAELTPNSMGAALADPYYRDAISFAADRLFGARPEDIRFEHEFDAVPAAEDFAVRPDLVIEKGKALTLIHRHRAYLGDHHFFTNEEYGYVGADNRTLGPTVDPEAFHGGSHYIIEIEGQPGNVEVHTNLTSTMDDDIPIVTYCSVALLLQSVVPVVHAPPGIRYHDVTPHWASDFRALSNLTLGAPREVLARG